MDRTISEVSALNRDDVQDQSTQLQPKTPPTRSSSVAGKHVCVTSTSVEPTPSARDSSTDQYEDFTKQDQRGPHASLKRSASHEWVSTLFDIILSLVPLFFLVVAVLSLCLSGRPVTPYGENIKAITLLSPTIFPIIYAAILGKVLRRIGLFKAERSSTVGTLEQLIGSQSFFATVERQFGMRRIDFLGIAIIAAWLLSPLGGQSSLRLLSTRPSYVATNSAVKYYAVESFQNDTLFGYHMEEYSWAQYAPLYMTALQTSRQTLHKPTDLFGNVTFAVESVYWQVRCSPFVPGPDFPIKPLNGSYYEDPYKGHLGPGPSGPSFAIVFNTSVSDRLSRLSGPRRDLLSFDYFSKNTLHNAVKSTCTATLRLVESEISCETSTCGVQKVRNSVRDLDPNVSFMSQLPPVEPDYFENGWQELLLRHLTQFMPGADLQPSESKLSRRSELVEQFIADPVIVTQPDSNMDMYTAWVNLTALPTDVFSSRLQMAMNTFWDSSLGLEYRVGNLSTQDFSAKESKISTWNSTNAVGEQHIGEKYVCNVTFAALTIAISLFLFAAACVSVVLGFKTRAPDVLGYVSTLARDDPYFGEPVPSHLDGMQATRRLRNVRVMLGDVHKTEDVGHVAFASMETAPERVNKRRLYD